MKHLLIVPVTAVVFLIGGCQKEQAASKPQSAERTAKSQNLLNCSPYRSVIGYTSLFSELNSFELCRTSDCSGSSVSTTLTNPTLLNTSGLAYVIGASDLLTVAQQAQIRGQAWNWATANVPAGYFLSGINFQYNYVPAPPNQDYSYVKVVAVYRKCTGGGGGEHS